MRSAFFGPGSRLHPFQYRILSHLGIASQVICLLSFLQFGMPVQADCAEQSSPPTTITLEDATRTALEKNPRISMARFQQDASAPTVTQARSGLYPRIDFSEAYTRTNNPAQAFSVKLNQEQITTQDFDPIRLNDCFDPELRKHPVHEHACF